jgi:hypothetical protein
VAATLLQDSRARETRAGVYRAGRWHVPVFCGSCGKDDGQMVPEDACDFAFYLCEPCAETYGALDGVEMIPDEVWFARIRDAQLEEYGRELSLIEQIDELANPDSALSKLARDRASFFQGVR